YSLSVTSHKDMGESCGSPLPLTFGSGEANLSTSMKSDWVDHTSGSCSSWTTSEDHVFRFTLDRVQNFEVQVTSDSIVGETYLRSVCSGGELVCGGGRVRRQELAPGTYYLWRDSPSSHIYDMYAHVWEPIPGDTCATARPLVFSQGEEGGTATDTATTLGTFDNNGNSGSRCSSAELDVVYTFTTSKTLDFRASAKGQALSLRSATCSGAELGCGSETLARGGLPPGTYYLWVDTRSSSTGAPFTLSASLTPPVPGDTCLSPEPLVFSNGSLGGDAQARGNLDTRFNNSAGSCAGTHGADHVFSFTTSRELNLRASTSGHSLYLRSADCQSGPELACGYWPALEVVGLDPGTYYLWVDEGGGPYTVLASLTRPVCEEPTPLVFTGGESGGPAQASAEGDTSSAFSSTQGTCGGSGGREVVYAFTTTQPLSLSATVTPKVSGFQPMLYLRASCEGNEQACSVAPTVGAGATLSTGSLPPGTYYLWVDGFSGSVGAYSLNATLR
ncbi:MAG TPA: hypothetical protein VK458_12125, partial [Myxococcaceae bacterium]|nr:hypothetical protein [Myxococcaceae bacterium]